MPFHFLEHIIELAEAGLQQFLSTQLLRHLTDHPLSFFDFPTTLSYVPFVLPRCQIGANLDFHKYNNETQSSQVTDIQGFARMAELVDALDSKFLD